jgi:hypothetical protein
MQGDTSLPVLVSTENKGVKVVCFDTDSEGFVSAGSKGLTMGQPTSADYKEVAKKRLGGSGRQARAIVDFCICYVFG